MDGKIVKMEKSFAAEVDAAIVESSGLQKSNKLQQAIEILLNLEKQTRVGADMLSNSRVLVQIVKLCADSNDFGAMSEQLTALSKKHGILKQAITNMVQEAIKYLDKADDALLKTLLEVTEGKVYVEVERARLTRRMAAKLEKDGKTDEAADTLQALQVETFGSMDKREKVDFILEQMRLNLLRKDYIRTHLISRKISSKYFAEEGTSDLTLRYYELMVQWALHDSLYLQVCQFYGHIYETNKAEAVLKLMVVYCILAPHDYEQSQQMLKIQKLLNMPPLYSQLLKSFTTLELIRWNLLKDVYGPELKQFNLEDLKSRTTEHNIRVVAQYYLTIKTQRLSQLLDLSADEVESVLSRLVSAKVIVAKIDRVDGVVVFKKKQSPVDFIGEWQYNVNQLLDLVARTEHLIAKEQVVHQLK